MWRLAKSLETLRRQLDEKYPNRSKASDGTIGDAAHSSTVSQHNPNKAGVVTALDITHDPANGVHGGDLAQLLIKDFRTLYVIWNRKIWDYKWIPYNGKNPHDRHVHVSVKQSVRGYDNTTEWDLGEEVMDKETVKWMYLASTDKEPNAGQYSYWVGRPAKELAIGLYKSNELFRYKSNNYDRLAALIEKVRGILK